MIWGPLDGLVVRMGGTLPELYQPFVRASDLGVMDGVDAARYQGKLMQCWYVKVLGGSGEYLWAGTKRFWDQVPPARVGDRWFDGDGSGV